jgi:4-amino-4-deoxy-L-arabinose transferase-like glycosyltransferase
MMKFTRDIIILFLLYLLLRLVFLFTFPPFTDESLYARWGMLSVYIPKLHWASLQYVNRQPLAMWLFGIGGFVFGHPLYGSRLAVFLANIPVFFLLWGITEKLFSRRVAVISSFLLAVSPLFILFQTLAMMDGLLFVLAVAVLWLITRDWIGTIPLPDIGIGVLIAVGLWIKSTAFHLFPLALTGLVWKRTTGYIPASRMAIRILSWIIIPAVLLIPLVIHPNFRYVAGEPGYFLKIPDAATILGNISGAFISLALYFGPATVLMLPLILFRKMNRTYLFLAAWFIIPFLFSAAVAKHISVRYIIIGAPVIPILLAAGLDALISQDFRRPLAWIIGIVLLCYGVFFTAKPEVFFRMFPVSTGEQQYAIGWTSGYGIREAVTWINARASNERPMILAVADTPGNPGDYILTYYYFHRNVGTIIATLTSETEIRKLEPVTKKAPVYLVTRTSILNPAVTPFLTEVALFPKPYNEDAVGIYSVSFPPVP